MSIATFTVKYPRPTKLSDPHNDFTPDMCEAILATPDKKLTGTQYMCILGLLPAGDYEEGIYFLPLAFRYLLAPTDTSDSQVIEAIPWFIRNYERQLVKDKLLETVHECVRELLANWTSDFVIEHIDKVHNMTGRQGLKGISYRDTIKNSPKVVHLLEALLKEGIYARGTTIALAEQFVTDLAANETDYTKAAWFLELANYWSSYSWIAKRTPTVTEVLRDQNRLTKAALIVIETFTPDKQPPTYWRTTFKTLGLE